MQWKQVDFFRSIKGLRMRFSPYNRVISRRLLSLVLQQPLLALMSQMHKKKDISFLTTVLPKRKSDHFEINANYQLMFSTVKTVLSTVQIKPFPTLHEHSSQLLNIDPVYVNFDWLCNRSFNFTCQILYTENVITHFISIHRFDREHFKS